LCVAALVARCGGLLGAGFLDGLVDLGKRRFVLAVMLSCLIGAAVDSALFLWLAFGSFAHIDGQILGKVYAALAFVVWQSIRRSPALFGEDRA
jgi:uncharacterized PurR-regulated membrane protein YhhQ (DUF165 family)